MWVWNLISAIEQNGSQPGTAAWQTESDRLAQIQSEAAKEIASLDRTLAQAKQDEIRRDLLPVLKEYGNMLPPLYARLDWNPTQGAINDLEQSEEQAAPMPVFFVHDWPQGFGPNAGTSDSRGNVSFSFGWFDKPITSMDTHPYPRSYAEDTIRKEIRAQRPYIFVPNWNRKKTKGKWDLNLTFEQSLAYAPETINLAQENEYYKVVKRPKDELPAYDAAAADLLSAVKGIETVLEEYRRVISGWKLSDGFLHSLGVQETKPGTARSSAIRNNRFWLSRR